VYLSGPYKGAPFSLSVLVAAQAGPFDLGNVVDAHVTVKSDPLPTIVEGIPLRLRQVSVIVDKPGFMLNPTARGKRLRKRHTTSKVTVTFRPAAGGKAQKASYPRAKARAAAARHR
jgi:hypothetical protein